MGVDALARAMASGKNTVVIHDGSITEPMFSDELKLETIKDYVTPEMFGGKGDGSVDDTNAISLAIASGKPVIMPNNYYITDTITIDGGKYLWAFGKIIYGGLRTKPAVKITGRYNEVNLNIIVDVASNARNSFDGGWHGWADDNYSGVELFNCYYSKVFVNRIINFTCGLKMTASGSATIGNFNNHVSGENIFNCKYGIYFLTTGNKSWMNTNTISRFLISTGNRNTDIDINSQNITTYGVYQAIADTNTYGLKYCCLNDLSFEVMTKKTFVGFYFTYAAENTIRNIMSEIDDDATFAIFDMQYPTGVPTTSNQQSVWNKFINPEIMDGPSDIIYNNAEKSCFSLHEIASRDDDGFETIFYDDDFSCKSINIGYDSNTNADKSSIKGYSFSKRSSDETLDANKYIITNYSAVSNKPQDEEIEIPTNYCLSLMIPVSKGETYKLILTGTTANASIKAYGVDKKLIDATKDIEKVNEKGIVGNLKYNIALVDGVKTNYHSYTSLSGSMNNTEFSIYDENIKYIVVVIYGKLHSVEIQKMNGKSTVYRHWGRLEFVNYLGNDKFMSDTDPTTLASDGGTIYIGQRIYKADSATNIGQYWELTATGWQ